MVDRVIRDEIIRNIRSCVVVDGKPPELCIDEVLEGDPRLTSGEKSRIRRAIER